MLTPVYFIPGLGQAVLAGELVVSVLQFLASGEFQTLKKILGGDGKVLLKEAFDKAKHLFDAEKLWEILLNDQVDLMTLVKVDEPKQNAEQVRFGKKEGALKKLLRGLQRFGKKLLRGVGRLKDLVNLSVKKIRHFVLHSPALTTALSYVSENFYLLAASIKLPFDLRTDKPDPGSAKSFSGEVQGMLNHLTSLQVPQNLIPLDAIVDIVITLALRTLKGPKGLVAKGVRAALEKIGVYQKIVGYVSDALLKGSWINPNNALNKIIVGEVQPRVQEAGQSLALGLQDVLKKTPGLENLTPPTAPKIVKLEDLGEDPEEEEGDTVPEAQPFAAEPAELTGASPLPAHPSGGAPLDKAQTAELTEQYGHNFSHVRVHVGAEADRATEAAGAEALTSGSHVFLKSGLSPAQEPGHAILRHELAHVLQQTGPRPAGEHHSDRPVDGKPGKGLVFEPRKEAEADQFAQGGGGNQSLSFIRPGGEEAEGIQPKLIDVTLRFFQSVSRPPDLDPRKHVLKAAFHARLSQAEESMAGKLPELLKSALGGLTFRKPFKAADAEIKQYLRGKEWEKWSSEFRDFVRYSKVKKKSGKAASDEANWEVQTARLEIALEEFIAIQTGIMLDIELAKSASSAKLFQKMAVDNLFLEKIRTDTNLWKTIIQNTFAPGSRSVKLQTAFKPADFDLYKEAAKYVIVQLDFSRVFAGEGFRFTDALARRIEEQVHPDLTQLHTGDKEDPIPINWYKHPADYPQKIKLDRKEYSMRSLATLTYGTETLQIGVSPEFIIKAAGGAENRKNASVLERGAKEPRVTSRTKTFRLALEQHGYKKMKEEDVDHVTDLGFGGKDDSTNFWPLHKFTNRIPFTEQWYDRYKIEYKEKGGSNRLLSSIRALYNKFFIIKGYDPEPERPGGRWKKKK
jgi:hypothetical protein